MTPDTPTLSLIVQKVIPTSESNSAEVLGTAVRQLTSSLLASGLWDWPILLTTNGRKAPNRTLESLEQLVTETVQRSPDGVALNGPSDCATEVDISSRDVDFALSCTSALSASRSSDLLGRFTELALELWRAVCPRAAVGPVFSIRPIGINYARPLPPRHSVFWNLGDAAYFISEAFHQINPAADPDSAAKLIAAPLPPGVIRHTIDGLTTIRCRGPAEDAIAFARQRFELEVWVSSVLNLPLHPEFNGKGDQRLGVLRKESASPFTFVDQMRGIAFKAVAESEARDLDNETRQELADVLKTRTLADGRKVRQTMVVFPTREAAVHNAEAISDLGASGAVYVADDNRLWNPTPPGTWIRTDWGKA